MIKKIIALGLLLAAGCGLALYLNLDSRSEISKEAHGTVDIRQSTLCFEQSGRILRLDADEGDKVAAGQILGVLDTRDLEHQLKIQNAQCKAYEAALSELENGYRREEIAMAQASVHTLENTVKLARLTYERYQGLFEKKSTSAQERDQAYFSYEESMGQLENAKANLEMLQSGYRAEQIEKARRELDACRENADYLSYKINEQSVLKAPFEGVIRTRLKEPGDMASASSGVFELSVTDLKRVRVYLTESQLGAVKVGQSAVAVTADGSRAQGKFAFISATAMYTPKSVQTVELRADLVWEVRLDCADPGNILRLGQPVTVEF